MKRRFFIIALTLAFSTHFQLSAHCQMPCGIYHDGMVYDQVDQYIETMHKAISELNDCKFESVLDRNRFVRWVYQKEIQSNEIANLILTYFLQQKIKPDDEDSDKKTLSAQKLLFLIVQIKQNTDVKLVHQFMEEWDHFKHMFHREGYECKIEQMKLSKWKEEAEALKKQGTDEDKTSDHDHDHDHDHPHTH